MAEGSARKQLQLLLLEDSDLDAELVIERLRRADLNPQVTRVFDRRGFEDALLAAPYDLILADYALPDFDGMSALSMSHQAIPNTPFIFISGRVGEEVAIETLQRGATDYVLKHRLERLVPAVLRALREAQEHATRVQAESAFRQSELRFRYVIDVVPQMIWISDSDGSITYANQRWNEYVPHNVEKWCDPGLIHAGDYPAVVDAWQAAMRQQQPFTLEARFLRADLSYRWHLLRVVPMQPDPDTAGEQEVYWLASATDLQDQKRNEEALRTADKLAVTGRMAAAIAHEINNPLESLTNLIFLVRTESKGNELALSYLDMTENELARVSAITKQTLQFYRDPLMPVRFDTGELIAEVIRLFATRFTGKGVTVMEQIEPGLVLEAIKGEIRQVLINLVNNAIDAVSRNGKIEVAARRMMLGDKPVVQISIYDDGSGIKSEHEKQLFQPFFSTKGAHGTGLGLWVSKGIVEKHGGSLALTSNKANGHGRTEAAIVLPVDAAPELRQSDGTIH